MRNTTLSFTKETKPFNFKKALSLNEQERELLVDIIPFLVIISAIFRLLNSNISRFILAEYFSYSSKITLITALLLFELFLFIWLFKRQKIGWILMCLFQGILLIYDLSIGNIFTGILTALIGMCMLGQIKENIFNHSLKQ